MIKYTGKLFAGAQKVLQETLLPCIFFGKLKTIPSVVGNLSRFPLKIAGLGLQKPVTSAVDKYTVFLYERYELIYAFTSEREFATVDNIQAVKEDVYPPFW